MSPEPKDRAHAETDHEVDFDAAPGLHGDGENPIQRLETEKRAATATYREPAPAEEDEELPFRTKFLSSPTGRAAAAAGLLVAAMAIGAETQSYFATEHTREAILRDQKAEAASLSDKQRNFLADTDAFGVAMAQEPADDFVAPELQSPGALDRLFANVGVYARVPAAEAKNSFAMQSAARYSKKDAVALCLLRPTEEKPLAKCQEGSMCLGEQMAQLSNLGAVNGGIRVLSPAWATVVETSPSPLLVGGYDAEFRSRSVESREVGKQVAENARFAILVVDETPEEAETSVKFGGVPPATAARFQGMPHGARLGIFDLVARKPLLKLRRELFAGATGNTEAEAVARQQQSCSLGLEARGLVGQSVSAQR
jgi:hypothetical protein